MLQALGVDNDVKEYPGAGHAFLNDHDSAGDPNPVIFVVMGKFAGPSGYHEQSAQDARRRIVAFFSAHLRVSPGPAVSRPVHTAGRYPALFSGASPGFLQDFAPRVRPTAAGRNDEAVGIGSQHPDRQARQPPPASSRRIT